MDIETKKFGYGAEPIEAQGFEYLQTEVDYVDDEGNVEEGEFYTRGDAILNQFYNGNWSSTMEYCFEHCVEPRDLIKFVEMREQEAGELSEYFDWFDRGFFAEYGESFIRLIYKERETQNV